jgi:hypothetical protein
VVLSSKFYFILYDMLVLEDYETIHSNWPNGRLVGLLGGADRPHPLIPTPRVPLLSINYNRLLWLISRHGEKASNRD